MDHLWTFQDKHRLGYDFSWNIVPLHRMYLDKGLHIFDSRKLCQVDTQSWRYTLVCIEVDFQCNLEDKSKLVGRLRFYIGCLDHKVKAGKDLLVL